MTNMEPLRRVALAGGLVGGPFGSSLGRRDYEPHGIPVIRGTNMASRYIDGDFVFVSKNKFEMDLARNSARPGDLIFTQRGTLGQVSRVPSGPYDEYVVSQSQMRLRVDPTVGDPGYIYYACTTDDFLRQIDITKISTGVPHINLGILNDLLISLPPLPEQKAIAEVLGALDDKIAANRKLADTADALIRALYDNLPDREGHALADVCTNVRSQVTPHHGGLAYVGLEHVPRRHMWLHDWGDSATVTSAKTEFKTGDILFGKLRPYFHKVVSAPMSGISSTDILVLRPKYPELAGLTLAAASSDSVIADTSAASEGTRMPRTKWSLLSRCSIRWPGDDAALTFSRRVIEIRDAIDAMTRESQSLASLRDTLLPALMDGTIRVKDAETHVEEVL